MKNNTGRYIKTLFNVVIILLMSSSTTFATVKYPSKEKIKLTPENLGPVAIVWRGSNFVGSNYYSVKKESKATGFFIGGLSGMLGGALSVGLKGHYYIPPRKDSKSGAKDFEKELTFAGILPDFNYQNIVKEQLMSQVFNKYQIMKSSENSEPLSPVIRNAEYSNFKSDGVKTVIEIYPQAFFTPRTGLSGEPTPCFAIISYFMDLNSNKIIDKVFVSKLAPSSSTQEYDEIITKPELIKGEILALIPQVVDKYVNKMNGAADTDEDQKESKKATTERTVESVAEPITQPQQQPNETAKEFNTQTQTSVTTPAPVNQVPVIQPKKEVVF